VAGSDIEERVRAAVGPINWRRCGCGETIRAMARWAGLEGT
jgi:hypothetical protein